MAARRRLAFVLAAVVLLLGGCGYGIAGRAGQMPGGVTELSIPMFSNLTKKPDIESLITSAFVNEMVTTVAVKDDAKAKVDGVIKSYELKAVSFTKSDVNIEYRLTVGLSLSIKSGDTVVWHDDNVVDYEDFAVNPSDVSATRDAEREALRRIAADTARIVKERLLTGF